MNDLTKSLSELKPQAKAWLTLTNIRLAIDLVFSTIYQILRLALVATGLYVVYAYIPWAVLLNQLNK